MTDVKLYLGDWRKIEKGNYLPTYYEIDYLVSHATGWVRDFAAELLREME